jgi:plasmid stabilization system protein ParE
MELKVIWTDPAIQDLRSIRNHITEDNPAAAISFGIGLFKSTRHLGSFPRSCRVYQETEGGTVRELIHQGYRIFYQEFDGAIEILHVRYGARDEPLFK